MSAAVLEPTGGGSSLPPASSTKTVRSASAPALTASA